MLNIFVMNAVPNQSVSPEENLVRLAEGLDKKMPWAIRAREAVEKVLGLSGTTTDFPFATTLALGLNAALSGRKAGMKVLALGAPNIDLGVLTVIAAHPHTELTLVADPDHPNPKLPHWLAALGLKNVHVESRADVFGDTNLARRAVDLVLAAGDLTPGLVRSTYASDTSYLRHAFPRANFLPDQVAVHGMAIPDRPRKTYRHPTCTPCYYSELAPHGTYAGFFWGEVPSWSRGTF